MLQQVGVIRGVQQGFDSARRRNRRCECPAGMALIDAQGAIVAVNEQWSMMRDEPGTALECLEARVSYLQGPRNISSTASRKALAGLRDVLSRNASQFAMDYACSSSLGIRYYRLTITSIHHGDVRAAIVHMDVSDVQPSKQQLKRLQSLARKLIDTQEKERRRFSRELHDDAGSRLALVSLSVREVMKQLSGKRVSARSIKRELDKIADEIADLSAALRGLSHWLHPPTLRCLGIPTALRSLQQEFGKSHKIDIEVVVPSQVPRLTDELEVGVFRIAQECLQNAVKHSGADTVRIVLEYTPKRIRLSVADTGRGFVESEAMQKGGLGLVSMEERALSLGGRLTLNTSPGNGTEILLSIPISRNSFAFRAE